MPSFVPGPAFRTPFGENVYLRSTSDVKTTSRTVAKSTITAETIDTNTGQKILQKGTVLATITSGPDAGKVGPFQRGTAHNEVQKIAVDATGGTFTITFDGETTADLAFNVSGADATTALLALSNLQAGDVVVTGGPGVSGGGTPYVLTFGGHFVDVNVPAVTTDAASLTGGGTAAVVTTFLAGGASGGATDGRQDPANIVGLCNTFLPWQLMDRDVEVSVAYECTAMQASCIEYDAAGARIALTDETANAMRTKSLNIHFVA